MPKHFPDIVDPWRLLDQEQVIESRIRLASMGRLSPLLYDKGGEEEAGFRLSFHRDRERHAVIHCEIKATLVLACQRCLEPMSLSLEIDSRLALVEGLEQAERLPEELEPLMLENDAVLHIAELVEDELLLAVPDAPQHSEADCAPVQGADMDAAMENTQVEPNPFDILAVLKKR